MCREVPMKANREHATPGEQSTDCGEQLCNVPHISPGKRLQLVSAQHAILPGEILAEDQAQQVLTT